MVLQRQGLYAEGFYFPLALTAPCSAVPVFSSPRWTEDRHSDFN